MTEACTAAATSPAARGLGASARAERAAPRAGEFKPESGEEEEEEEESSGGGSSEDESLVDSEDAGGEDDEDEEEDLEEAGLSWEELEEEAMQCAPAPNPTHTLPWLCSLPCRGAGRSACKQVPGLQIGACAEPATKPKRDADVRAGARAAQGGPAKRERRRRRRRRPRQAEEGRRRRRRRRRQAGAPLRAAGRMRRPCTVPFGQVVARARRLAVGRAPSTAAASECVLACHQWQCATHASWYTANTCSALSHVPARRTCMHGTNGFCITSHTDPSKCMHISIKP